MSKLYLPIGLIGAGKSTWARQFIQADPNVKIVAGDAIRYMFDGDKKYKYSEEVEPAVADALFASTQALLYHGYDVILDECYCSLNVKMRRDVVKSFTGVDIIPVIFPEKDMEDHIEDKVIKGLRGKTIGYWKRVFCEMKEIYEPFDSKREHYFNKVIDIERSL